LIYEFIPNNDLIIHNDITILPNTIDTILNKTPEIRRHEIGNTCPFADLKAAATLLDILLDDQAADPSVSMAEH